MKRVLFLSLILAVGMTGFAQRHQLDVKNDMSNKVKWEQRHNFGKEVDMQAPVYAPNANMVSNALNRDTERFEVETMITQMDLQSNAFVANRMYRFDDGTVGVTATFPTNGTDRGTGYNYFDGTEFGDQPEARIEGLRTGWPSYCQYGDNGEIVVAHTGSDLVYYTRENKGEGEWQGPKYIPNPDLGFPDEDMTWPRVVTSGPHHNIIHVISASQDGDNISYDFYSRSTDGENWVTTTPPTMEEFEWHTSADSYALAANGDVVAMLYCGNYEMDAIVIKSYDNGETWERHTVWDNPYAGMDWDTPDPATLFSSDHPMYMPENGAICIDNNGKVHGAFSSECITHEEDGVYVYSGLTIDGIFYWNEDMGPYAVPEWTCPEDEYVLPIDPHNAFRFWFPTAEDGEYVRRNFEQPVIGFVDLNLIAEAGEFNSDLFHHETEYRACWLGCSATPAICINEDGNIAIAYSAADPTRIEENLNKYYRSVFVSYIEEPYHYGDAIYGGTDEGYTEEPGDFYYNWEYLQDPNDEEFGFIHGIDEALFVNSITNTTNNEFWFSYQADMEVGFYVSSNSPSQSSPSDNYIWAVKLVPDYPSVGLNEEVVNPMNEVKVYPNPVTDVLNINVNASQASEMNISVYNITGQKVMEKNVNIHGGINTPSINTSNLTSGIYFVTVKANGFENTLKFIVK